MHPHYTAMRHTYAVPSSDTNMARWPVHPAWFALQAAYCSSEEQVIDTSTGEVTSVPASSIGSLIRERIRQVNIERLVRQISGCTSTLSAWLGGKQDDLPLEGIEQVPILKQTQDYHFVLHWLHEQMPRYVMAALEARVAPEHPEILWQKYGVKFAEDVQSKRVLYGLQASGVEAPALGSDGGWLPPVRDVMQEVLEPDEYREWLEGQL